MRDILEKVARGEMSLEEAETALRVLAVEEVGSIAKLDAGREVRHGVPEVIIAEGKTPADVAEISTRALERMERVIISRAGKDHQDAVVAAVAEAGGMELSSKRSTVVIRRRGLRVRDSGGRVGIVTAGTSDIPVAEEAEIMAAEMGCQVMTAYDVGAAGVHRLFPAVKEMITGGVDVIVVVAGREGALPTLLAGMVDVPLIAVPTSYGYGLGGKGVGALIAMLQSCSLGLAVVNIDGGIPAGAVAALIANRCAKFRGADAGECRC